jgi:LPS-assembly lipoprotein
MQMQIVRIVLLSGLLAAVAACGFHPRATVALRDELGPVQVQTADPYSPLAYGLSTALTRAGAQPAVAGQPAATLDVKEERMQTRPLTLDSTIRVREYETRYIVKFELRAADGTVLVPTQEVELTREYTYDALEPGGSPAEQELLQNELRRDMQAAILRRVDVVLRAK